jgi:cell division protein FtsL
MPPVEETPEYDLAVVPHRPYYYWICAIIIVMVMILLALGSYYSGFYRGTTTDQTAILERDQLRVGYAEIQGEIQQLEQNIANLRLGSQVDRKATEQVRMRVVELKNRIAELERDNTFYRDLMRTESSDQGISVTSPAIELLASAANTYEYKMVVKQLSANRLQVVGYLEFAIVGKGEDGKSQRFTLHQLSQTESSEKIKLNFRYFQRFEGQMVLPDAFNPERIELKIVSFKPKKTLIEKTFNWIVKES